MKELNIRIYYPDRFKSKEVLSAVRDYLMELINTLDGRLAYRVEDIKDDYIKIILPGDKNYKNVNIILGVKYE